jgi:hypothetical protein
MRRIDTAALTNVAGALGVGAPATATEDVVFDDRNLQQVLDVSRALPGLGLYQGFHGFLVTQAHVATGSLFNSVDPYNFVDNNAGRRDEDWVWVLDVNVSAIDVTNNDIARATAGASQPIVDGFFPTGINAVFLDVAGLSIFNSQLRDDETADWFFPTTWQESTGGPSGGTGQVPRSGIERLPYPIMPGGLLRCASQAVVPAGTISVRFAWLLWAGPKGIRPPKVA